MKKATHQSITDTGKPFPSNEKRFSTPGVRIRGDCPDCNRSLMMNLKEDYLSYPRLNAVNTVHLYCEDCDAECSVNVRVSVTVALVDQ